MEDRCRDDHVEGEEVVTAGDDGHDRYGGVEALVGQQQQQIGGDQRVGDGDRRHDGGVHGRQTRQLGAPLGGVGEVVIDGRPGGVDRGAEEVQDHADVVGQRVEPDLGGRAQVQQQDAVDVGERPGGEVVRHERQAVAQRAPQLARRETRLPASHDDHQGDRQHGDGGREVALERAVGALAQGHHEVDGKQRVDGKAGEREARVELGLPLGAVDGLLHGLRQPEIGDQQADREIRIEGYGARARDQVGIPGSEGIADAQHDAAEQHGEPEDVEQQLAAMLGVFGGGAVEEDQRPGLAQKHERAEHRRQHDHERHDAVLGAREVRRVDRRQNHTDGLGDHRAEAVDRRILEDSGYFFAHADRGEGSGANAEGYHAGFARLLVESHDRCARRLAAAIFARLTGAVPARLAAAIFARLTIGHEMVDSRETLGILL